MKALDPGQKLRDVNYGPGVVLTSDAEYTTIRFRAFGIKKFITSMIQMELIEKPKPQKGESEAAHKKSARKAAKAAAKSAPARKVKAAPKKKKPATKPKKHATKKKAAKKSKKRR